MCFRGTNVIVYHSKTLLRTKFHRLFSRNRCNRLFGRVLTSWFALDSNILHQLWAQTDVPIHLLHRLWDGTDVVFLSRKNLSISATLTVSVAEIDKIAVVKLEMF